MTEPKDLLRGRPFLESLLRYLPGFRGYMEPEYRREADQMQRDFLAERLQRARRGLDELARRLTDQVQLDALPLVDRVRARLDKLMTGIQGAMPGYSAFFSLVQVDSTLLDKVYEFDAQLTQRVEGLAQQIEQLPQHLTDAGNQLYATLTTLDQLEEHWQGRDQILRGMK